MAKQKYIILLFLKEIVYHFHRLKMPEVLVQSIFERDKLSQIVEDFGAHDHQWEPKIISLADASPGARPSLDLV